MKGYRRYKGWDGTIWHVKMTKEEIEFRERVEMVVGVIIISPVFAVFFAALFGWKFF